MLTSTPKRPLLQKSPLHIEEFLPYIRDKSTVLNEETPSSISKDSKHEDWQSILARSEVILAEIVPKEEKLKQLTRSPVQIKSIPSEIFNCNRKSVKKRLEFDTNDRKRQESKTLQRSHFLIEDIAPEMKKEVKKRSCGTATSLTMEELLTKDDALELVGSALSTYRTSLAKETSSTGCQCSLESLQTAKKQNQAVQVNEPFRMRSNIGVTAKPTMKDVGTEIRLKPCTRNMCVGPDLVDMPVSLNMLNSTSRNYGETKFKTSASKSVGVMMNDLLQTHTRGTDTSDLAPKYRDVGTSTIKKEYVDVSVGDYIRPHISISCAANYCDNCKETIKSLAKQIANNEENSLNHQNANNMASKIPKPSHIPLNITDYKKHKRQDTYTKIPTTGMIKYDTDNKQEYDSGKR